MRAVRSLLAFLVGSFVSEIFRSAEFKHHHASVLHGVLLPVGIAQNSSGSGRTIASTDGLYLSTGCDGARGCCLCTGCVGTGSVGARGRHCALVDHYRRTSGATG